MRITDVQFIPLRCPLPEPVRFSLGTITHRHFGLVRIRTDKGITGWGETFVNFPSWAVHERKYTVEQGVKPLLAGEDPLDPAKATAKMLAGLYRLGLQWGAKGCMYQAISGANIALWDIKGQVEGVPVYRLLGGESRPIPLYATGLNMSRLEESARACLEAGFKAVKMRMGFDEIRDIETLRSLRNLVGPEVKIYVDINQGWAQDRALELALQAEEAGADWIEEPVPCDDLAQMSFLAARLKIPLAAGENYFGTGDYTRALEAGALDIGMPDITRVGGFDEMIKICRILADRGLPYSPHHYGTDVGFVASLHLMASAPTGLEMLRDVSSAAVKEEVLREKVDIGRGLASLPEKPGLGVAIREEILQRYSC